MVLDKFHCFWKLNYLTLSTLDIVDLGSLCYSYEDELKNFDNLDGKEFIRIYAKKTFYSMREIVETILKSEREIKAIKDSDDTLITNGPTDLFKLIYGTLEFVKTKKFKFLIEQLSIVFKEVIIDYLIAVDYLVQRKDLDIDKEFLLAVANNSIRINSEITDLVEELKNLNILEEKEIEENLSQRDLTSSLNLISANCNTRIVEELFEILLDSFQDNYFELEIEKLCRICLEIFSNYANLMHYLVQKKLWTQVLNTFVMNYLNSLLTTANKKIKKIEDLKQKLTKDKESLLNFFEAQIGKNATEETLRILDEFIAFINSESDFIVFSCKTLREFCGPSFKLSTAKALINLRVDFDKQTKADSIASCKSMLDKMEREAYEDGKNTKRNPLFDLVENSIKLNEIEEKEKVNSYKQQINTFKKKKTIVLSSFLKFDDAEEEKKETENEIKHEMIFFKKHHDSVVDNDIIISGYLLKKSNSSYQNRYFTLKNGTLYWYMSHKARESQNSIAIIEIQKINAYKDKKFEIIVNEKDYKFMCENDEIRDNWVNSINGEIKKLKKESKNKLENIFEVKLRKREINDLQNLPNIFSDKLYLKKKIEDALLTENSFYLKKKITTEIDKESTIDSNKTLINEQNNNDGEIRHNLSVISTNSVKVAPMSSLAIQLLEENKSQRKKKESPFTSCMNWFKGLCQKKGHNSSEEK